MSDSRSALEKHIAFFSEQGYISYESMRKKLITMKETVDKAAQTANIVSAVGGLEIKWCPYRWFQPKEAVGVLNHSRDTSIFSLDGSINEARWQELLTYAENDKGTQIITEIRFYEFLNNCRKNDTRWDPLGFSQTASNGEWSDFFTMCADYWKESEGKDPQRSVTIATLRKFYDNTPDVFNKVVTGELPVAKPQGFQK